MRDCKNQEPDYAEDNNEDAQQAASNQQIGHPLVFGSRMGDAEGGNKCLGEPGEEFQCGVRF